MAKDNFEERRQNRIDYHDEKAGKRNREAQQRFDTADQNSQAFYGGQPILVGHHSEGKARRLQRKIHGDMRKGFELQETARYHADKVTSIENNTAIFSDDPEALTKLRDKLETMKAWHEKMKARNKVVRSKKLDDAAKVVKLVEMGMADTDARELLLPDYAGRVGYPRYMIGNSNGNIGNVRKRIAALELDAENSEQGNVEHEVGDLTIVENYEANRIQIIFPGKPDNETRDYLKKRQSFRWSGRFGAWQRHLNGHGRHAVNMVLSKLGHPQIKF